jgi:CheY-like chemotaxis protein
LQQHQTETGQQTEGVLNKDFAASHPLKIMVAEDNEMNQELLLEILRRLGYAPALATTGTQAIAMLDKERYDLVLMDVHMPEMDGLEATRYIRTHYARQPHIIAITAGAMVKDREECYAAGMDNYLAKPIKLEALITLLQEVVV